MNTKPATATAVPADTTKTEVQLRAIPGHLYLLGDSAVFPSRWSYYCPHSLEACLRPGYFNPLKNHGIRVCDQIDAVVGLVDKRNPAGAIVATFMVFSVPLASSQDVIVGLVRRDRPTPSDDREHDAP